MKLITYTMPSDVNYGSGYSTYRQLYKYAYYKLIELFDKHKVKGHAHCYVPYHWSVIIHNIMEKMLNKDPDLKFYKVFEVYGKLSIEVVPTKTDEQTLLELSDLKHEAQNRIDSIVHNIINKRVFGVEIVDEDDDEWLMNKSSFNIIP